MVNVNVVRRGYMFQPAPPLFQSSQSSFVGERDLAEGAVVMVSKGGVRTVTELLLVELDRDCTTSGRGESERMTGEVDVVRVGVGVSPLLEEVGGTDCRSEGRGYHIRGS